MAIMDHQAFAQLLGNHGEFVGALGVVASLVYLGIQMRQNTIATERANARQIASDHSQTLRSFMEGELAEIISRGHQDLDTLTPVEKHRWDLAMSSWLEIIEQAYADSKLGAIPQDLLEEYRNRLSLVVDTSGGRKWWAQNRAWTSPPFRADVDRILEEGVPAELESGCLPQVR